MKRKVTWAVVAAAVFATAGTRAADKETRQERRENRQEQRQERREDRQERREVRSESRTDRADIDQHVDRINALDNRPAAVRTGMAEISKQTAIPLKTIEAQHQAHPKLGLAALLVANELATRTHKPAAHFIKEREEGKSWAAIARANGENLDTLESKLIQVETAMKNAQ